MENILEIMSTTMLGGDTLSKLSAQLHEPLSATRRGLESAVPASVSALAEHASSEHQAEELLGALRSGAYPHVELGEIAQVVSDPAATTRLTQWSGDFMKRIFGDGLDETVDAIAGQSGLSHSSAGTVLGLATPLVLGAVSTVARSRNLDAAGLARFLADQGRAVLKRASDGAQSAPAFHRVSDTLDEERSSELPRGHSRLWTAVLIGALVLLALTIFGRRNHPDARDSGARSEQAAPPYVLTSDTGASALASFLAGSEPLPRTFVLQGVQFSSASAALAQDPLLNDVAEALNKDPQARVRVEGFSDSSAEPEDNAQLAQTRAGAVKDYLASRGVSAERIEATGRPAERPAGNDTPQTRAQNRRIELTVVER